MNQPRGRFSVALRTEQDTVRAYEASVQVCSGNAEMDVIRYLRSLRIVLIIVVVLMAATSMLTVVSAGHGGGMGFAVLFGEGFYSLSRIALLVQFAASGWMVLTTALCTGLRFRWMFFAGMAASVASWLVFVCATESGLDPLTFFTSIPYFLTCGIAAVLGLIAVPAEPPQIGFTVIGPVDHPHE